MFFIMTQKLPLFLGHSETFWLDLDIDSLYINVSDLLKLINVHLIQYLELKASDSSKIFFTFNILSFSLHQTVSKNILGFVIFFMSGSLHLRIFLLSYDLNTFTSCTLSDILFMCSQFVTEN